MKKQNKKRQDTRFIDEKLKTKSLMFLISFLMWFARFQSDIVNRKAFGASFLYWVDFTNNV